MAKTKARMSNENEDAIVVTDENFGELLLESLTEVRAIVRGEAMPARRTVREAAVDPPRTYDARGVQQVREQLGLSQAVFAGVLNSSPETVKAWEQGKRVPDGIALALLQVAEDHPQALLGRVRTRQPRS